MKPIILFLFSSLLIAPYYARNTVTCNRRPTPEPTPYPTDNPTTAAPTTSSPTTRAPIQTPSPITLRPSMIRTKEPTSSNNNEEPTDITPCKEYWDTDIIILNDISCPMTTSQCQSQQQQIADTIIALKGYPDLDEMPKVRVGYIEFDANTAQVIYSLIGDYNKGPVEQDDIQSLGDFVAQSSSVDCDNAAERGSTSTSTSYGQYGVYEESNNGGNLLEALHVARDHFNHDADSGNYRRDRKIVIFSNCPVSNQEEVCDQHEDYIRTGDKWASRGENQVGNGLNVVMVNQGQYAVDMENYMLCLVEYDQDRILINPDFNNDIFYGEILPGITDAICKGPTIAPTIDPTTDPTSDPTNNDYDDATTTQQSGYGYGYGSDSGQNSEEQASMRRLLRRLQDGDETDGYEVEFVRDYSNAPCIYMELNLETENLLPNNMQPDVRTNIQIIGRALGNSTGGSIIVPDPIDIDPEDEDYVPNPELIWEEIDPNCTGKPQIEDTYWPKDELPVETSGLGVTDNGEDGFVINIELKTRESIVYRFELNSLNLSISHDCAEDLIMIAGIYMQDELIDESEYLTIADGDESIKTFYFDETVKLGASKTYEVRFELIKGYPTGCDINNVKYNDLSLSEIASYDSDLTVRRRLNEILNYHDIIAQANPDSCTLSANLAISDAMKTGVSAMCQTNTQLTRPSIEAGLFQQHASQSAIRNHLFKTGSLHLFDEEGTSTLDIEDWPEDGVQDPCIAVDDENRIIYAIGGHDGNGSAVDRIQGYQFDDDTLTNGNILEHLREYTLDKARYGSECFYWYKDEDAESGNPHKLIVISGMAKTLNEFYKKSTWHQDIQMFEIPQEDSSAGGLLQPRTNPHKLVYNFIDAKPLLVEDVLYFFGGKTQASSKPFVTTLDLNNFGNTPPAPAGLELTKGKALPLIDQVNVNCTEAGQTEEIKKCYMVFAGQSYEDNKLVENGIETDYLQLFCNDNIPDLPSTGVVIGETARRLQDDIIPSFTEFDMKMLSKGKEMTRRRLAEGVPTPESDVFMRNYDYSLDGLYYNFSVVIEQCYNDNDELREAEEEYINIISSKQSDNNKDKWNEFTEELEEKILAKSKQAYRGWNNLGFGDVDIWDLNILNVTYKSTPSPTKGCDDGYKHTERRKARYYYKNYDDKDIIYTDDMWIDNRLGEGYADEADNQQTGDYGNDNLF